MPGKLRNMILSKGAEVAEAVRRPEAVRRMVKLNSLIDASSIIGGPDDVSDCVRNSSVYGHVILEKDAMLLGCTVHQGVTVRLREGAVAYDCDFNLNSDIGAGCTLFCCCIGPGQNAYTGYDAYVYGLGAVGPGRGQFTCGSNCVLADFQCERRRLRGRDGYQSYRDMENAVDLKLGRDAVLLQSELRPLSTAVSIGSGMVSFDAAFELGWSEKTSVATGNGLTAVHGYRPSVRVRQLAMFNDRDPEYLAYKSAGLVKLLSSNNRVSTHFQLMCHCGKVLVGDDVNLLAPMMVHAQKELSIGDGCSFQPAYATESQLRLLGRNIRFGKQTLVVAAAKQAEQRQSVGSITNTGVYSDIETGWKSRLTVVSGEHRRLFGNHGVTLGDGQTGYM